MLDFQSIVVPPSNLAVGSLLLANKLLKNEREQQHSKTLRNLIKVSEADMMPQIEYLYRSLKDYQRPGSQLMGLKKKFSTEKFSNVSTQIQFNDEGKERKKSSENKSKLGGREAVTTDKKRTVSGEKLARPAATMTCQKAGNNTST